MKDFPIPSYTSSRTSEIPTISYARSGSSPYRPLEVLPPPPPRGGANSLPCLEAKRKQTSEFGQKPGLTLYKQRHRVSFRSAKGHDGKHVFL